MKVGCINVAGLVGDPEAPNLAINYEADAYRIVEIASTGAHSILR